MTKPRFAIVGSGSRSRMFSRALLTDHREDGTLVALCDPNRSRMDVQNEWFAAEFGAKPVPGYDPGDFVRMLDEQHVDTVIVTSVDRTHDHYIVAAMEHGRDVITEKPLTTDEHKCERILRAQQRTGQRLVVTFNYRYAPRNAAVRELLASGVIGQVQSVHFEWLLDTRHGADYFRRWHRDKRNSGGLMIHKSSHHFDLVNWWLSAVPQSVFGFGDLRFYGRANAEARGQRVRSDRSLTDPHRADDPWAIDLAGEPDLKGLYLDAEHEDGYVRDRTVFSDGISIEDDMSVLVRYDTGATLSYHLTAYAPWEGYRVGLTGTAGRVELDVVERSYVSGEVIDPNAAGADQPGTEPIDRTRLTVQPHWQPARRVPIDEEGGGGHGGGDRRLLADIFAPSDEPDPLGRAAGHLDGAYAMLTGAAANRSFATGLPVQIRDLAPTLTLTP